MFPYDMVVFDIDGTIKEGLNPVSSDIVALIENIKQNGCYVTYATGRMSRSARNNSGFTPNAPMITYQGAQILDFTNFKPLKSSYLNKKFIDDIIELAKSNNLKTMIQYPGKIFCDENDEWLKDYAIRNEAKYVFDNSYKKSKQSNPLRIVIVGDPKDIYNIELLLNDKLKDDVYITRSLPHFCEVLGTDSDKSNSIDWVCDYLNIDINKVIAFGDSYNDTKMLKAVGYGIAVNNSVKELKEVADEVLSIEGVEGIYQFLRNKIN